MMTDFLRPETLTDALHHLATFAPRVLAGGTDLYPATQARALPGPVMDVALLDDLRGITQTPHGLRIGACTTWSDLIAAPLPPALLALQQAAITVGGKQIQNAGTIGGNLCNASPAADGVPPLLAADALVELSAATGTRTLPLSQFLIGPRQTALQKGELLTAILVPPLGLTGKSQFLKLGARAYLVISIAMVAVRLVLTEGRITNAALAVGSCSATARRLPELEAKLIGLTPGKIESAIHEGTVAAGLAPLDDLRATAAYRNTAATELLRRAIHEAVT
jgi:CO/xanthine dehydrogenase FAD-binding subunit